MLEDSSVRMPRMSPYERYGRFGRELHGYDTAQVCLNGHVITQFAETRPEHLKKFCDKCGATLINSNWFSPMRFCSKCGAVLDDNTEGSDDKPKRFDDLLE